MSTGSSKTPQTAVAGCTVRWRPSAPEPPPRPLRASSSGVWIAPAATTTASGADLEAAVRGRGLDAGGGAAADEDALGPGAGDERRARLERAREVDLAGVLLGARRAAEGADAGAPAAARVAAQVAARPAEPLGAAADRRRVAAGQLGGHLGDADRRLDALEDRVGDRVDAVLGAPAREHGGRRAEAGARVDERRPARAAPERQHQRRAADRGHLAAVAVEPRERVARAAGRVREAARGALLEHDHAQPALGELRGRDRPAGAAADHAHVGAQHRHASHRGGTVLARACKNGARGPVSCSARSTPASP